MLRLIMKHPPPSIQGLRARLDSITERESSVRYGAFCKLQFDNDYIKMITNTNVVIKSYVERNGDCKEIVGSKLGTADSNLSGWSLHVPSE